MSIPQVSVLMPVYNAGKYLDEAIESILDQTFSDFEFIIINDGSTDGSNNIIAKYAEIDARIKFINRENRGLISTLNEGIRLSQGKYIARMDQDDVSLPLRFEKQVQYLNEHYDCVTVGVLGSLIDADGDLICGFCDLITHEDIDSAHIKGIGGALIHPAVMMRRNAIVSINCYSEDYPNAEDLDLWLRLAEYGKLANISDNLFLYRQHIESIGYANRLSQIKSSKKAVLAACQRRGLKVNSYIENKHEAIVPSVNDIYIKWGWWALKGKNINTARKYSFKALIHNPFNSESWKLFACGMRGH